MDLLVLSGTWPYFNVIVPKIVISVHFRRSLKGIEGSVRILRIKWQVSRLHHYDWTFSLPLLPLSHSYCQFLFIAIFSLLLLLPFSHFSPFSHFLPFSHCFCHFLIVIAIFSLFLPFSHYYCHLRIVIAGCYNYCQHFLSSPPPYHHHQCQFFFLCVQPF